MSLQRSLFLCVGVVFLMAASAEAQPTPDCAGPFNPYNVGGDAERMARCAERRPYVPVAPPGACVQPYPDASVFLCEPGASATLATSRVELRPLTDFAMRWSIPQAALGQAGRELAYVNVSNLEDTEQAVLVEVAVQGRPGVILQPYTLAPKTTRAIGLHGAADPMFAGRLDVSVTTYFMGAGTMNVKWLRGGDHVEVASESGVIVPRVP